MVVNLHEFIWKVWRYIVNFGISQKTLKTAEKSPN